MIVEIPTYFEVKGQVKNIDNLVNSLSLIVEASRLKITGESDDSDETLNFASLISKEQRKQGNLVFLVRWLSKEEAFEIIRTSP